ncbi:MAG: hypothetical protein AAGC60_26415 [Acidobacteriota bacterium]
MTREAGIAEDFHSVLDGRYDFLLETDVATASAMVQELGFLAQRCKVPSLRLAADVPSGSDAAQRSVARVFRLEGQTWAQVMIPFAPSGFNFLHARDLAERLATRVLLVEGSDDSWGGHALFGSRGEIEEIQWLCVADDLRRVLPKLGLEVPAFDEDELYEETEFAWSTRRPADEAELSSLVVDLGARLDAGSLVWEPASGVERLDLLFDD